MFSVQSLYSLCFKSPVHIKVAVATKGILSHMIAYSFQFYNNTYHFQVALPQETTTGTCFLQHYIESVLALQEASCKLSQGLNLLCFFFLPCRLDLYLSVLCELIFC